MARYFGVPFATTGDKIVIPDAVQPDGSVSYSTGFGFDYQRPDTDPGYKPVPRDGMNGLFHDITDALGDMQRQGVADWTVDAAPYPINAMVRHSDKVWRSRIANNNDSPTEGASWTESPVFTYDIVWRSKAIGERFALPTHMAGIIIPPTDNPDFRFIKLTAGDAYNAGALTSESVTGAAPLVMATAVISLSGSPLNGVTVRLWNTEGRYSKPGTSSGTVAHDQMQQITGSGMIGRAGPQTSSGSSWPGWPSAGAITQAGSANLTAAGNNGIDQLAFNSANSPGARTGNSTDVKHEQETYFMRIK